MKTRAAHVIAAIVCASLTPAEARTVVVEDGHVLYVTPAHRRAAPVRVKAGPAVEAARATAHKAPVELVETPPQIDPASPPTQPLYPAASRRFEEQGTVVVGVLVLPNGRVGESWVETTSGYHRLDDAAVGESRRWRFIPATKGDVPIAAKKNVVVRFALD